MTGEQGKAGEWLEEAMDLAEEAAKYAWDAGAAGPYERMWTTRAEKRDSKLTDLRAALTQREEAFAAVVEAAERLTACYRVSHSPAVRESCWAQMSDALALARAGEGKV